MADTHTKFLLSEDAIPTHWVNLVPDLPGDPLPPLHPRHDGSPRGPTTSTPIFPMALILQEVSARAGDRDPRRRCARPTSSGARRRCTARGAWRPRSIRPARIYYKYEGVSPAGSHKPNTAVPQAYENAQAGIRKLIDRDRRRAVGLGAGLRLPALRPGVRGLHGRLVLRPEALPALDDADLGRDRAPLAVSDVTESGRAQRRLARPARWASRSPRPSRSPPRTTRPTTRWARCSTTCCCTRPSSARRRSPRWSSRATSPTSSSAASAAARTSPAWPIPWLRRKLRAGVRPALRRRRAGRLPDADPGRLRLRLRRHRRAHAADADVHARPRLRAAARARRRPALPRRRAVAVRARQGRRDRGARLPAERDVRRGAALRAHRGDHPGARARARDPRGHRGGRARRARPARSA